MTRQPTPSHNAAHVLVSFQNESLFPSSSSSSVSSSSSSRKQKGRPLSLANATRPPQNRRRVWRACESCRKKKIKCDGSDPCQCCLDNGSECVYAGDMGRRPFISPMNESFGKRVTMLEELVGRLMEGQRMLEGEIALLKGRNEGQNSNENQNPTPDSTGRIEHTETRDPDCSIDLGIVPDHIAEIPPILDHPGTVNTIDPELVERSSHSGSGLDLSVDSAAREPESASAYMDDYGQMYTQGDDAQYIGLGGTVTVANECPGLRAHIRQRLLQKGLPLPESILNARSLVPPVPKPDALPPVPLMDALIDAFFHNVYKLFPIIEAEDFQRQYLMLLSRNEARPGFVALLYTILAVSSSQIPPGHPVWGRDGCMGYKGLDLGSHFYSLALSESNGTFVQNPGNINAVTALTLLGMYLSQIGLLNEAYNMVGQAVRLGYAIGLHRSPKRMALPPLDVRRRCQLWWCLYVMDRLLSLHLGRPVAISDHDSDVLFPSARPSAPGFVAMTHLCRIIGRLLSAVNSIENAHKWRDQFDEKETQTRVEELSAELQSWKQNMLPEGGLRTTEQCVLLSSYYSAVQLLFRTFMPTPHWQSTIADLAMRECFDASTDCIRMSGEFIAKVPACHYYAFHGHNLFVSVMGLLHCIRQTNDRYILSEAEEQSLRGVTLLSQMEKEWPMATQYKAIAEEYEAFTQERVQQGNKGRCIFEDHIATLPEVREESTFDPWGEFAAQIELESNIFPSMPDAAWMSELFQLSPQPEAVPLEADVDPPPKRRRLENGRDSQPVCGFSLKRSNHGH